MEIKIFLHDCDCRTPILLYYHVQYRYIIIFPKLEVRFLAELSNHNSMPFSKTMSLSTIFSAAWIPFLSSYCFLILIADHPWLQNAKKAPNVPLGDIVRMRLKQFSVMNRFKKKALRVSLKVIYYCPLNFTEWYCHLEYQLVKTSYTYIKGRW